MVDVSGPRKQGSADAPDTLDIAVRAFAERTKEQLQRSGPKRSNLPSEWTLVFDTETTIDASQRLRLGTYEIYKGDDRKEGGLFYVPGDPSALDSSDIATIKLYATRHNLKLLTDREFVDDIFYEYGFHLRASIVAFNLPFDISRLAIHHNSANAVSFTSKDDPEVKITNRSMVGGFTFKLSEHSRANVRIKHRSNRDAFYQFTALTRGGWVRRGFFVDVRTIGAALLGRPFSLRDLAAELRVKHRKLRADKHGGPVTDEYLEYAMRDTVATWECFQTLRNRYGAYGLSQTPLHTLHTEASVGKAHLKEMGVRPWTTLQKDFSRDILGAIMCSYFGGRSEVHIRRKVTQVLYCDVLSMYPSVSVLMGLWRWVIADGVTPVDATDEVQRVLENVTLADLQNPAFWPTLTAIVQVQPDDDILPVRAQYRVDAAEYRLALNRLTSDKPLWFTLADCIASKLLTGKAPKVLKATRFQPGSIQSGLSPINIAGNPAYRVEPASEDFYKRLIDLRQEIKKREKVAKGKRKSVLGHEQIAIKNVANATTYGIFIELNVSDEKKKAKGSCYGSQGPFPIEIEKWEQPGSYFHPLIAVFTTGAARLMLATAERLAIDAGLDWVFCDTDSMALARPQRMTERLFLKKAEAVRDWFTALNPYSEKGPVFKIEDENFRLKDGKPTKEIEPLYCYAISPKRYALFNLDSKRRPIIRKALEHGLGHLMSPLQSNRLPDDIPKPAVKLKDLEIKPWQYCLWYRILGAALATPPRHPKIENLPGFDRRAATRYGASTPTTLMWCKGYNASHPQAVRIKPFNFMLRFYVRTDDDNGKPVGDGETGKNKLVSTLDVPKPIAPYSKNVREAERQCFDRDTGRRIDPSELSTYFEELAPYHVHPDPKVLGARPLDSGATRRRHVFVRKIRHIGKEADKLEPQIELGFDPDAVIEYGAGGVASIAQIREDMRGISISQLHRASGVSRPTLIGVRDGALKPSVKVIRKIVPALVVSKSRLFARDSENQKLITLARTECDRVGLTVLARILVIHASTLLQVINGKRRPTDTLLRKLTDKFDLQ